jgi:AraC-like DNA-binding protein
VPRQRQEYGLLALSTLCRWITRRDVQPRAAEFIFPEPVDTGPYLRAFGCPVSFNQQATRLLLDNADLDMPLPSSDPMLFDMHQGVIEARLVRLGHASTGHRVSEAIVRLLHLGEPRREAIASSLAMADRTLQRRLQEEGTSFQQLLDDARRDLAQKYLAEERYTLGQVADLLGFADQSNFFRAHKRWFGMSHIDALINGLAEDAVGGLLAVPVCDTIKRSDSATRVRNTVDRADLWHALTPQMFRVGPLMRAIEAATRRGIRITDECSAVEAAGYSPRLVMGRADNIKITRPEDLALAEFYLRRQQD